MGNRSVLVLLVLALACLLATIALITVRHEARMLQDELNKSGNRLVELRDLNRRYMIELASVTDYNALHVWALRDNGMEFPSPGRGNLVSVSDLAGLVGPIGPPQEQLR